MLRSLLVMAALIAGCGSDQALPDGGSRFDAGPPQPCPSPGAVETVSCGACGTVERFCTAASNWAYGTCMELGECMPGTTDEIACGNCGTATARCNAECTWDVVGECTETGECAPGSVARSSSGCPPNQSREVVCSEACAYDTLGACVSDECTVPGSTESVSCGACGTQTRFCTSGGVWEYGPCEGGELGCIPGTMRTSACGACGTQRELCGTDCSWRGEECTGEGECFPGQTRDISCGGGQTQPEYCTSACSFEPSGPCQAGRDAGIPLGDGGLPGDGGCVAFMCKLDTDCCPGTTCQAIFPGFPALCQAPP